MNILFKAGPKEFMAEHTLNNFLMNVLVIVMLANKPQDYGATAGWSQFEIKICLNWFVFIQPWSRIVLHG